MRKFPDVIIYERDICRIHSDITSNPAHCNPDKCFFQRRSIIDSIPDHADLYLPFLGLFNPGKFLLRKTAGVNFFDVQHVCNVRRGISVVSGQKNWRYAGRLDLADGFGSVFPEGIGKNKKSGSLAVNSDINDCASLIQPGRSPGRELVRKCIRMLF